MKNDFSEGDIDRFKSLYRRIHGMCTPSTSRWKPKHLDMFLDVLREHQLLLPLPTENSSQELPDVSSASSSSSAAAMPASSSSIDITASSSSVAASASSIDITASSSSASASAPPFFSPSAVAVVPVACEDTGCGTGSWDLNMQDVACQTVPVPCRDEVADALDSMVNQIVVAVDDADHSRCQLLQMALRQANTRNTKMQESLDLALVGPIEQMRQVQHEFYVYWERLQDLPSHEHLAAMQRVIHHNRLMWDRWALLASITKQPIPLAQVHFFERLCCGEWATLEQHLRQVVVGEDQQQQQQQQQVADFRDRLRSMCSRYAYGDHDDGIDGHRTCLAFLLRWMERQFSRAHLAWLERGRVVGLEQRCDLAEVDALLQLLLARSGSAGVESTANAFYQRATDGFLRAATYAKEAQAYSRQIMLRLYAMDECNLWGNANHRRDFATLRAPRDFPVAMLARFDQAMERCRESRPEQQQQPQQQSRARSRSRPRHEQQHHQQSRARSRSRSRSRSRHEQQQHHQQSRARSRSRR